MKILNSPDYVTLTIEENETRRFEAFLDRNFSDWRAQEIHKAKRAGTICREWFLPDGEIERCALYRKQYVEIRDRFIDLSGIYDLKQRICDIDGGLTPVAVWRS